jgi:uncharacterized sulfatase
MGTGARYHLTPFTETLATSGLVWNNFLSNSEKSYGVLPSLLASLPSSLNKRGFINLVNESNPFYPNYSNFIDLINKNDYQSLFFYGGWGQFDNVNSWIKNSGINHFIDQDSFDESYKPFLGSNADEFIWGYNDSILFDQAYEKINTVKSPHLSIIQTISLHSPFNIAPKRYFNEAYLAKRVEQLNINYDSITGITNNELSCIIFADDALRSFFKKIETNENYKNTIFIITGDHALNGGLIEQPIDNYHVPLIIYSPLLKKTSEFNGVSSHTDVTPTMLSLLKNNFNLTIPKNNSWIGNELDTSSKFQIKHSVYFNLGRLDLPLALFKEGLYYNNKIYPISKNLKMDTKTFLKETTHHQLNIESLTFINSYIINNNKIYPTTIR